ncbi:oxidoreductase, short-chain dehydrogenase/reductase family [Talaromyces stipitatus ATCC 10500]|uniref:Oxidoreductase, short-chain dehydrogenase/reductase family n=1 Tax=Talaromyces stipitatus (strain ATCC 10500 / CBS 375.48 / QM 6759 / NRRL 1006) TaxID=441959 RepID=B8MN70_TALSN|nr:oxidoreductase, short-chain dehydrogenase/reductase family [Talaromyces stipitatus ATCC 10500]EED14519.1 oxidoreductase, short-chain dehydrogenase/reductase family [Talaromyces stipitatus ATCC 10500]
MIPGTQLDGVALVVGSGRGIGQQAAFSLAEAGARAIVFADMNEETATASAEESKQYATNKEYQATAFKVNVTDEKGVQDMVDFVVKQFGRIDYAVNGAGVDNGVHAPIADTDIEGFDRIMTINARGMLLCVRAEAAAMRKQEPRTFTSRNGVRDIGRGAIVNVASANSSVGLPGKGSYTISKHACLGLTKMAGLDHSPEGIRCNAVCPTWVRTPLLDIELEKNPEVRDAITAIVPIKRAAECEEVSEAITFLLSPAASYINGTSLILDAGVTTSVRVFRTN